MLVPAERFELPTNGLQNSWSSGKLVSCIRVNVLSSAPPRPQECTNRDALLGARVRKPHRGGGGRAVEQRFFGILAARAATPAELAQDASSSAGSRADAPMSEVSPRANWACPALRIFIAATRSALAS